MLSKIFSGASRRLVETAKILTLKILSNAPRGPRGRFGCLNAGLLLLKFAGSVFRGFSFSDVPNFVAEIPEIVSIFWFSEHF